MNDIYGGGFPALMFKAALTKATSISNPKPRPMPGNIVQVTVCSKSGKLPSDSCPQDGLITEYCLKDKVPTETCDAHEMVSICPESGKLAGKYCPNPELRAFAPGEAPTETCDIHTEFNLPAMLNNEVYVCRDPRHKGKLYRANVANPVQSGGCPQEYLEKVLLQPGQELPYCPLEDHQLKKKKAREVVDDIINF